MAHRYEREGLEAAKAVIKHQLDVWLVKRSNLNRHVGGVSDEWNEATGIIDRLARANTELAAAISQANWKNFGKGKE